MPAEVKSNNITLSEHEKLKYLSTLGCNLWLCVNSVTIKRENRCAQNNTGKCYLQSQVVSFMFESQDNYGNREGIRTQ